MSETKKEITSTLLFLGVTIIVGIISFLLMYLLKRASKIDYLFLFSYILICVISHQINKKYKSKLTKNIAQAILLPFTLLVVFASIAMPILSIQVTLGLYLLFSFIFPWILYKFDKTFHFIGFNFETWVYLIITFGILIAFIFHKQIKFFVYQTFPFTSEKSKDKGKYNLEVLNNYVISINNIRLVIFSLYFLYLIVVNFMNLEGKSFYENANVDKAVLQSFVTFIAFDRVLSTLKQTEFKPSELVTKIWMNIKHTFD